MHRIMFVCLGNICRSPMAEFVFRDMVEKAGLGDRFYHKTAYLIITGKMENCSLKSIS